MRRMLGGGTGVRQCASDRRELVADVAAVPEAVGTPDEVLADNGYATEAEVKALTDPPGGAGGRRWRRPASAA